MMVIPEEGSIWQHAKTGGLYRVLFVAHDKTSKGTAVVYETDDLMREKYTRSLGHFLNSFVLPSPN